MKQAVVVGGTRGIGLAIANGFADSGWQVVAAGLEPPPADTSSHDRSLQFIELDVRSSFAVQKLFEPLSRVDALINCAGMIARVREFEMEVFEQVIDTNLTGAMRVALAAREKMRPHGGSIVHIASMLTYFGGGLVPAYSASKGGIGQLTKSLAIAWAPEGIRVNAIAPGWIETPMTQAIRDDEQRYHAIKNRTPLGRWGKPEEIVGPALFLTSEAAGFITGAILNVDGGYSIY